MQIYDWLCRKLKRNYKLFESKWNFSRVAGYKINIQKSPIFLYVNNKLSEKLRKQSYLLYHTKKKIPNKFNQRRKRPIHRTMMLMKGIEEDTNKLKDISCSQIRKINLLKHPYYGNPSTNVVQSSAQIRVPVHFSQK